jgi:23S rRNA (guanosine2251-2'-O)-methyltransferase
VINQHNQGIALEASEYPYAALEDLFVHAQTSGEPPFFLLLDRSRTRRILVRFCVRRN